MYDVRCMMSDLYWCKWQSRARGKWRVYQPRNWYSPFTTHYWRL